MDSHPRPGKIQGTRARTFHLAGQGGYCARGSSAGSRGFLFKVLSPTEKGRRSTANFRLAGSQRVFKKSPVLHAEYKGDVAGDISGRVVYHDRLDGCLFPRTYCLPPPEVSSFCVPRTPLSVPSPSVRSVSVAQGVHQVCRSSFGPPPGDGVKNTAVLRRLVGVCSHLRPSCSRHSNYPRTCGPVGTACEFAKEQLGPYPGDCVFGCCSELQHDEGLPVGSESRCHHGNASSVPSRQGVAVCSLSPSPREAYRCLHGGTTGVTFTSTLANVAEQPTPRPLKTHAQAETTVRAASVLGLSGPIEGQVVCDKRGTIGLSSVSERGGSYRRVPHRMGRDMASTVRTGVMVPTALHRAHQCTGTDGSAIGPRALPSLSAGQTHYGAFGQHNSGPPHQPSGGDQIGETDVADTAALDLGGASFRKFEGHSHSWNTECDCGLLVPPAAAARRMETPSRGSREHLGDVWQGGGRPVCFQGDYSLSPLVFACRQHQSSRSGCTGARLAQDSALCFPTIPTGLPNTDEGPAGGSQVTTGSPVLARQGLVSIAAQALLQLSETPAPQEGSPVPAGRAYSTSRAPTPPTLGVATAGAGTVFSEYGGEIEHTISNARAPSTRRLYANRWKLFEEWCRSRGQDAVHCPVSLVLQFLQELLNRGRSPSTLKVYVAAISCWHRGVAGSTLGSNRSVSLFLKGARRLHPPRRPVAPMWDLSLVLDSLGAPPFEPLEQADLRWVSLKTAFLLAITSGKRVGELQALSVHESCCRWNADGSGVTLWPDASFMPKVLSSASSTQPLQLARFDSGSTVEPLCPVRALDAYMRATVSVRKSDCLFVCYAGPRKGQALSKQRLAHWVVEVIKQAYTSQGRPLPAGVRCHSTRSLSTSWAAMKGVPLDVICAAASWTSPTTFARFYRVNIAVPHPLEGILRYRPSTA